MAFLVFPALAKYCFHRMVKERLGLPKDQTIVFNVHRFVTNCNKSSAIWDFFHVFRLQGGQGQEWN